MRHADLAVDQPTPADGAEINSGEIAVPSAESALGHHRKVFDDSRFRAADRGDVGGHGTASGKSAAAC
ncbi:hypothetical protein ACFYOT_27920 [Saccharothrix saharensis]|uniref:hypothetical protein n=1 Tax=Saccharothrix saharensis TaxID=571190 RepID=UPI0036935C4B